MDRVEAISKMHKILEPELTEIVNGIENGISTTQNNYGAYMSAISNLNSATNLQKSVVAELLILSGANKSGVLSAVSLLGG